MSAWEGSAAQEAWERARELGAVREARVKDTKEKAVPIPPERETSPDLELSSAEMLTILVNHARLQLEATRLNGALLAEVLTTLQGIRKDLGYPLQRFVDSRA